MNAQVQARQVQSRPRKLGGLQALLDGLRDALQWRLLLLWVLGLLLPTAIVALPLWDALAAQFDHNLHVGQLASGFDAMAISGATSNIGESGAWFGGIGFAASMLVVLLTPWLSGMVVASIRTGYPLGFTGLVGGGLREYGRMLRTLLWSLLPLGAAFVLGSIAVAVADKLTEDAILAADADRATDIALFVMAVLLLLAHASVEAGRGMIAANPARRSVVRAWGRGVILLLRRPLAVLLVYLGTALVGYGLAFVLGLLRIQASGGDWLVVMLGLLVTQLLVAAIAYGRSARLYAMADLARDDDLRRQRKSEKPREPGKSAKKPFRLKLFRRRRGPVATPTSETEPAIETTAETVIETATT